MIGSKERIVATLRQDFKHVESLNNYEVFRREMPGELDDDQEDGDDEDPESSSGVPANK